jgi:hypothetical protein
MISETSHQDQFLTREPAPAESRVDEWRHPVKDGEIMDHIQGYTHVPLYSLKQVREIKRIRIRLLESSPSSLQIKIAILSNLSDHVIISLLCYGYF